MCYFLDVSNSFHSIHRKSDTIAHIVVLGIHPYQGKGVNVGLGKHTFWKNL